jgi:hypothetical protein
MRIEISDTPVELLRQVVEKCREGIQYQHQEVTRLEQELAQAKATLALAGQAETRYAEALAVLELGAVVHA